MLTMFSYLGPDKHVSIYSIEWLIANSYDPHCGGETLLVSQKSSKTTWGVELVNDLPITQYDAVLLYLLILLDYERR